MSILKPSFVIVTLGLFMATTGLALAQATKAPPPAAADAQAKRVGDAYAFDVCPISGKKLGGMGNSVVKMYDGREVRFCCDMCPPKFEKDLKASLTKLDEKIIKDQAPLYPLTTSVVTGSSLPEKPVQFVYGNRLILVADATEQAEFMKNPQTYFETLNKAVIEKQSKEYPLAKCPVSGDELGSMGKAKEIVVAGRLIRLCCSDCIKDIEKDPAKYVLAVDDARKQSPAKVPAKP